MDQKKWSRWKSQCRKKHRGWFTKDKQIASFKREALLKNVSITSPLLSLPVGNVKKRNIFLACGGVFFAILFNIIIFTHSVLRKIPLSKLTDGLFNHKINAKGFQKTYSTYIYCLLVVCYIVPTIVFWFWKKEYE